MKTTTSSIRKYLILVVMMRFRFSRFVTSFPVANVSGRNYRSIRSHTPFLIGWNHFTFENPTSHKYLRSLSAKPKRGSVVESYQTVSVNCSKCRERLFRYKKKNGTKSNLVKCFLERVSEDSAGILEKARSEIADEDGELPKDLPQDYIWECPSCKTQFARSAIIKGLPALKMVGGKIKMTKK